VALGLSSGRVLILDTRTGRPVQAPAPAHRVPILWVGYSRDGSRILSAGGGGLQIWDAATGQVQDAVTIANGGGIGQFRPGTTDVTILSAGRVLVWDTRPEHALEFACRAAGRDLTADEWSTYLGTEPRFQVCPS
jgi:hypothetical protein